MKTWKKVLPDYEFMFWNEDNFPIGDYSYARKTYDTEAYAFASDVVRLYALNEYGGIWLDTDVEMLKPFDDLLDNGAFLCRESDYMVATAVLGAKKGHPFIQSLMKLYERIGKSYEYAYVGVASTRIFRKMMEMCYDIDLKRRTGELSLPGGVHVYPANYFQPANRAAIDENTYCIHHSAGWKD